MTEKKVYFNEPQRLTQLIGANTTVIVAERRTGKTASAKTTPASNLPIAKKTCSNPAPTAPTLSILYTSEQRDSHITIPSPLSMLGVL